MFNKPIIIVFIRLQVACLRHVENNINRVM